MVTRRVVGFAFPVRQVVDAVDVLLFLRHDLVGDLVYPGGGQAGKHVLVTLDAVE